MEKKTMKKNQVPRNYAERAVLEVIRKRRYEADETPYASKS